MLADVMFEWPKNHDYIITFSLCMTVYSLRTGESNARFITLTLAKYLNSRE